jgi:hypothetical protein
MTWPAGTGTCWSRPMTPTGWAMSALMTDVRCIATHQVVQVIPRRWLHIPRRTASGGYSIKHCS